jgi:hypothetical protein
VFLFLAVHLLLSASEFGGWTQKDITMKTPTSALNDVSLSTMEPYYPAQFSIAASARENDLNLNASLHVQTNSMSTPKRFVPLSAPARGSV